MMFLKILKKRISGTFNLIVATSNPWTIPLVMLKIKKQVVIKIRSKPETFTMKVNIKNYKVLYHLCWLRNRYGLVFRDDKVEFPPHKIRISPEQMTKDQLMMIHLAYAYGLLVDEFDDEHYLIQLKDGHKFTIRQNSISDIEAINETFVRGFYRKFCKNLKGKTVLDVGAFIGDTPIMFSHSGAKMIYAYEPDPEAYDLAIRNMKLNNISNVKLLNVGVSDTSCKLVIEAFGGKKSVIIDVVPLSKVIEQVGEVDILKMDCEGCEFPAVLSLDQKSLCKIKEMIIEYHNEPLLIIKKLSEGGFDVKVEKPWTFVNGKPVGLLYAKR